MCFLVSIRWCYTYIYMYTHTYIHTFFYYRKPFEIVSQRLFLRTGHLGIFCPLELKTPSRKQFLTIFMVYILAGHAGVATIKKYIKSSISTGSQIVQLFLWAQLLSSHWALNLLNNFHFLSVSELILYKRHGLYNFIKSIEDLLSIFKWHIQPKILPGFYYQMNICLGNNIEE